MTNKERQARRRAAAREKANYKRVRKAVAVNMQSVRSGVYQQARQEQERFVVDPSLTWYVIRTLPRWAARAADQIAATGIPVFQAREAIRLVSEIGKTRVALVPVLRRLVFVGVRDWRELRAVEKHPGVYDDATGYRRSGVVERPGGGAMVIAAGDLQNFADCITGYGGDAAAARQFMFDVGQEVVVETGPFEGQAGRVTRVDGRTGRVRVDVIFAGGAASVEIDGNSVRAA